MTTPTAVISYSWDDEAHKAWVKDLAARLRADGVDVILDRWESLPGSRLTAFMERAVTDSDFVLTICTPGYKERFDARRGGVGYEGHIITSEAHSRGNDEKFIPIRRSPTWDDGEPTDGAPVWARGKYYIDLSDDPYSEEAYEELVRTLLGIRETAPPIGEPMSTLRTTSTATAPEFHPQLSDAYFARNLKGTVEAVGSRYTRKPHVELEIIRQLETFGRTEDAVDRIKALATGVRQRMRFLSNSDYTADPTLEELDFDRLLKAGNEVLEELAALVSRPAGQLPLITIAGKAQSAETAAETTLGAVIDLERQHVAESGSDEGRSRYRNSPFTRMKGDLYRLQSELHRVRALLTEADGLANKQLVILKGAAGTGKTHLLCDFASSRVASGAPAILLLGHRFTETAEPWTQVLRLAEMHDHPVEHFLSALEEAARAANSRALLIIDAVNEGRGREIWPSHLSAFLARLEEYPSIAVALSVRSTYEQIIIPEEIRTRAASITHHGFAGHEYEAVQAFFADNGLEFPSAPVMQPEFRNPLFLKTISEGLSRNGETRLRRGLHGFTSVFDLYLNGVNSELALTLDYNPRDNPVREALNAIADKLAAAGRTGLPRREIENLVNGLLPREGFSNSLYHGLVTAGVLIEDVSWGSDTWEEAVLITYERLSDHIIAQRLLQEYLDTNNPEEAFAESGGLAFLSEGSRYVPAGWMEALCIQVPEQTGRELIRLAPPLMNFPGIGRSFQESLIWREIGAFTEDTGEVWNQLINSEKIWDDPNDTLLTVSTIPGHPFNAKFLDQRLRRDPMAERDAWWSIYLHESWNSEGPVDRLVDWALAVVPGDVIDEEVVELVAITLAWMLTASNRFLRDRATKALVALLTDRLEATAILVERFSDVDDPYVVERVYAVAYGVAMRGYDQDEVGRLALLVYEKVFAGGCPPAHVLLRDYARGVIERAIQLDADIAVELSLVRPPYRSAWPHIPDEAEAEALIAEHRTSGDSADLALSVDHIRFSVSSGDFGTYVIGRRESFPWLSLPLTEEPWQSPEERTQRLLPRLSEAERLALEEYDSARMRASFILDFGDLFEDVNDSDDPEPVIQQSADKDGTDDEPAGTVDEYQIAIDSLMDQLMAELTEEHRSELLGILAARDTLEGRTGPRFDPQLAQRYIIWRVFDLGWTIEQFGQFDRYINWNVGRIAAKPERIGKKYQWIAYHEFLAYLADHYQYRPSFTVDEGPERFLGPWQEYIRDIDPSWLTVPVAGGDAGIGQNLLWLRTLEYTEWGDDLDHEEWLARTDNLPRVEEFLKIYDPDTDVHWLVVDGNFSWEQPHPADVDRFDAERRRLGMSVTGYFMPAEHGDRFAEWISGVEGWRRGTQSQRLTNYVFFGEYGWAPAFEYYSDLADRENERPGDPEWKTYPPPAGVSYESRSSDFDCSENEGSSTLLPNHELIQGLGLRWSGKGAEFLDEFEQLAAFGTTDYRGSRAVLLIREDLVRRYIAQEDLMLCWAVMGEKMALGGEATSTYRGRLNITGFYRHTDGEPSGSINCTVDVPGDAGDGVLDGS